MTAMWGWVVVILPIPDEFVERLVSCGGDLSCGALEALALEECKLSHFTIRRIASLGLRGTHGLLKGHGLMFDYTLDDLERERQDPRRLGL